MPSYKTFQWKLLTKNIKSCWRFWSVWQSHNKIRFIAISVYVWSNCWHSKRFIRKIFVKLKAIYVFILTGFCCLSTISWEESEEIICLLTRLLLTESFLANWTKFSRSAMAQWWVAPVWRPQQLWLPWCHTWWTTGDVPGTPPRPLNDYKEKLTFSWVSSGFIREFLHPDLVKPG